jgi:flagellin-like hook-associated protein FlgL
MSLVINHNMMAMNTARNLNNTYNRLNASVQRLSSGLRINSAADDAAGLAIRELMRADISTMQQGIRNAADAISMIQTADGAMAVIDEKLVRMKELAEQAATGTYTTLQREIINSEYQAMAAEIDRIANSTNFNGVKLLDGSITNLHGGQGMKIHFGVGNSPDEDYYFINTGDVRATSNTGLRIGGDAKNDIWGQGAAGAKGLAGPGCCTAGYDSLDGNAGFVSGQTFSYGYNWDWTEDDDPDLLNARYLAGRYTVNSSDSLQDLVDKVNEGTQSRVGIKLDASAIAAAIKNLGTAAVCVGDEAYVFGSAAVAGGTVTIPAVEGSVHQFTATGGYSGAGFMVSNPAGASYGFGLTQAQIAKLEEAGLDLSALGLSSALVSASGSSLVNSAQAQNQLLSRLVKAWTALNLNELSGLAIASGVATGFSVTSATLRASAGSALTGTGLSATISAGQTLVVHTGVYADANGNWTDSARIASALGLQEIKIELTNTNQSVWRVEFQGGANYKSPNYLAGTSGGVDYRITSVDRDEMTTAGVFGDLITALKASASATANMVTHEKQASAESAFLSQVQADWNSKYANMTGLAFRVSAGANLTVSSGELYTQGASQTGVLTGANNTSATIEDGFTLNYRTGIYVDTSGNFTTNASAAALFGAHFTEIFIAIKNSAGNNDDLIFSAVGLTSLASFPAVSAASSLTEIAVHLETWVRSEITARQTAIGTGNLGEVYFFPPNGTTPAAPSTFAELGAISTQLPSGTNLTATIEVAGVTTTLTSPPLGGQPNNTDLGALVTAVNQGLTSYLNSLFSAAGSTGQGRIEASLATPPVGPNDIASVDNPQVVETFYSGTLDRSVATGTYSNSGDVYSSPAGYALTSSQLAILAAAGVDLTNLNLTSAVVSASAASTVSSADARAKLLTKLSEVWSALGLAAMSAITVDVGVSTGYSALTSVSVAASAGVNALSGSGSAATLKEQRSLTVHTGVYADANGNWTDDKRLASALGLSEIIYTVQNNTYTPVRASADFFVADYWSSGDLSMNTATKSAISGAGLTAVASFFSAYVHMSASASNSAAALINLQNDVQAYWTATYGVKDEVAFSAGDTGASRVALTPSQIFNSDPANILSLTGQSDTDVFNPGGTVNVKTGVYLDANGNWTDDSGLAKVFGLEELTYSITENAGNFDVTIAIGGVVGTLGATFTGTHTATDLKTLGTDIATSIGEVIAAMQTAAIGVTPGKVYKNGSSGQLPAPTSTQVKAATTYKNDPPIYTGSRPGGGVTELDISVTLDGNPAEWRLLGTPAAPVGTSMGTLAGLITTDVASLLADAQFTAVGLGNEPGRLLNAKSSTHSGPINEIQVPDLATSDIYKEASGPKTVTSKGIVDSTKHVTLVASAGTPEFDASGHSNFGAWALASAINHNPDSQFWAMVQPYDSQGNPADMVYVFTKKGGDFNSLLACDVADGDLASQAALQAISFENVAANEINQSGTNFTLGGEHWGTLKPVQTKAGMGKEVWNLTLDGRDVGKERDLWIAALANGANEINTPGLTAGIINGLDRYSFVEIQNADNGPWKGAEVRTQSSAQEALEAINDAMTRKDKVRADIGALQNRLENTITNLEIQMESLQASESRISDVDVATEMTEFVRNQVLAQAAVSMLSQANSLPQMALSLLNG